MYDSSIQGTFTNLGEIKQAWAIVIKFEGQKCTWCQAGLFLKHKLVIEHNLISDVFTALVLVIYLKALVSTLYIKDSSDQFRCLGDFPPTPLLNQHFSPSEK